MMLLKRLKISHKITVLIAAGIILATIFAAWAVQISRKDTKVLEKIYLENLGPLDNLRGIQLVFRELEYRMAGVQADVVAAIESGHKLEGSLKEIDLKWDSIRESLQKDAAFSTEDTIQMIEMFEKGYSGFKVNVAAKLKKVYLDNEPDKVEDLFDEFLDYKPLIFKSTDNLADMLKQAVKEHYLESQRNMSTMNTIIIMIAVIGIGFFGAFAVFILKSINKPIVTVVKAAAEVANGDLTHNIKVETEDEMGSMADKLNLMINHLGDAFSRIVNDVEIMNTNIDGLSSQSAQLLEGAEQQRVQGEQVAVASTEMSQTIVDMARNTSEASDATRDSLDAAKAGKEIVSDAVSSITNLAGNVGDASKKIEGLGSSVHEIGEIVSTIKDIADQTNLLALNAAIEAARSGEHGRGFAVVADEVKKLAERTAKATEEIDVKIHSIQTKSEESISTMEEGKVLAEESVSKATEAGEALQKIVESSDMVMDMVHRVAAATEEQSAASEEVSRNMEQISNISKDHFGLAEAVEKEATNLSELAREVFSQTSHFRTKKGNVSITE